jgi:adenine-specific DNA methylase
MNDKPRLIEVAFPLKQASIASVHEKNVRQGHLSTLHIWPARRPLAACRAALLATLLPDPGDPEKRKVLLDKIGGQIVTKAVEEVDDDGNTVVEDKDFVQGGVLAWGQENERDLDELRREIFAFHGGAAPRALDPFAGGGAIPLEAMRLGCDVTASDLNPVAWFILKCTLEYPQAYAGKTWPLPGFVREWPDFLEDFTAGKVKRRKGDKQVYFSDPLQFGLAAAPDADLSWQVRAWGRWVLERAKADLSTKYPVIDGEPTVAYLSARTARDKVTAGRIPLLKSFWLCKKKGQRVALLPVPSDDSSGVTFALLRDADLEQPENILALYPHIEPWGVNADNLLDFLKTGTMNRAGVWSPISGRPGMISLTMDDLRRQGQQGLLATQMTVVVVERMKPGAKKPVKFYRLPAKVEIDATEIQTEELEAVFHDLPYGIPNEPLPPVGTLGFRIPLYGFKKWREVFTPRQLLSLGVFVRHTRRAIELVRQETPHAAEAIGAYLGILFGRFVNYMSTLCIWDPAAGEVKQTFSRYALPMNWDFAEANPLSQSDRYYAGGMEVASKAITSLLSATELNGRKPHVEQRSSVSSAFTPQQIIFTDPPYYDAIPYSDLMDFFYIWQKRLISDVNDVYREAYRADLGPKWNAATNDGELIQDESRFGGDKPKAKQAYEDGMARSFQRCFDSLADDGRFVVVFANKDVDAWETLVSAMIRAGFLVVASWPIQTEMTGGFRNFNRASLSSSIWIVCRKRPKSTAAGWQEKVLEEMKKTLFDPRDSLGGRNILQYYFDLGISGPDFIWAALGPALEAYSAHPFVKRTQGGVLTVSEFLREVRRIVLQFCLGELPGFRDFQRETQGRGESLEMDPVTQYYLLHRAYFGLEPTPAGACILYANACGKKETELKVVWNILEQGGKQKKGRPRKAEDEEREEHANETTEGKGHEYRLIGWQERSSKDGLGESKSGQPAPLVDKLHRLMFLLQQNRASEVQERFDVWGLSNERAFKPLLQAVRELALRDKQVAERRLVEALATQLRMNRKTIMVANEMKEVPLFDSVEDIGQVLVN